MAISKWSSVVVCTIAFSVTGCGGDGGSTGPTEISCPSPAAGKITVCGQIADVESGAALEAAGATGASCGASATAEGPCSVAIRFYDAVEFAANPSTATPIAPTSLFVDDYGRYRAESMTPPASGFLAVAVDDAEGTADRHRTTIVVTSTTAGTFQLLRAFVTEDQTDTAWSTSAGLVGSTFADRGVIAAIFRYHGVGRTGVTITGNGSARPADDFYFSDAGQTYSAVDSSGPTGTSGGVLFLNSALVQHSGTGGEPSGCQWPSKSAASIPGVVLVQLIDAVTDAAALCP